VNQIDADTTAVLRPSTVMVPGTVTVKAEDTSTIRSAAGGIAVAVGLSSSGNGGAGAFGAAFSINNIGSAGEGNFVCADVDNAHVQAGGGITVDADSTAEIFVLAIGAAGSASAPATARPSPVAWRARPRSTRSATIRSAGVNGSTLDTTANASIAADDDSSINSTAGSARFRPPWARTPPPWASAFR
jgi:hypothetical protein